MGSKTVKLYDEHWNQSVQELPNNQQNHIQYQKQTSRIEDREVVVSNIDSTMQRILIVYHNTYFDRSGA